MIKKKFAPKEKVKLAIAGFAEGTNKTEFCAKYGISRSALYNWQKAVLAQLSKGLK